jgi:hypothetical protein
MPGLPKFALGGIGAVVPTALSLIVVDLEPVLAHMTLFAALGLVVKVVLLFAIGGLWAWLHKQESQRLRVFELGIVAPAMILSVSNGLKVGGPGGGPIAGLESMAEIVMSEAHAQPVPEAVRQQVAVGSVRGQVVDGETGEPLVGAHVRVSGTDIGTLTAENGAFELNLPAGGHTLLVSLLGFSYGEVAVEVAAGRTAEVRVPLEQAALSVEQIIVSGSVEETEPPPESRVQQFFRGFLGRSDPRAWYVAGEEYGNAEDAARKAHEYIVALNDPAAARVYEVPDPATPARVRYVVVFGTNLNHNEALALQTKIDELGLSNERPRVVRRRER